MLNPVKRAFQKVGRSCAGLATIAILAASGPVQAGEFESGLDALQAGDTQRALEYLAPLAKSGHPDAQHALGMMYEYGRGVERGDVAAAAWYEKAAEQGMPEAQYRLGVFYENGWGVARDASLAVKWYERAAQRDHAFAQHDLALMYLNGTGVEKDGIQAYKWLKIASLQRADVMTKHLVRVAKTLSSADIERAEKLANAWLNGQKI